MNSHTPPCFACLQSVVTFCYRSVMMDAFYRMTMQDRTEELITRVAELDARHDEWLREGQLAFGRFLVRVCRSRAARWLISGPFSRLSAYMIVEKGFFGVEKGRNADVMDIAVNWLKIPLIRMPDRC